MLGAAASIGIVTALPAGIVAGLVVFGAILVGGTIAVIKLFEDRVLFKRASHRAEDRAARSRMCG